MAKNTLELKRNLKFGIELEIITNLSQYELTEALNNGGVKTKAVCGTPGVVHAVSKKAWKVVRDGSVSNGWELVSPPSTDFTDVEKVCKVLETIGATVNKSCGFHVHHEIKDLELNQIKNIYRIYDKYESKVIEKLLPMSRREGSDSSYYCKPLSRIISKVEGCNSIAEMIEHRTIGGGTHGGHYRDCRYRSLNFRAYITYGTIEFRHHSGTTDFEKIKNWVLFTHRIIETAIDKKTIKPVSEARARKWEEGVRHSSYDLYKELNINGTELSEYLGSRRRVLNKAQ